LGVIRYSEVRLDGKAIQDLPDGSIMVTAQLTRAGVFSYETRGGPMRREWRPEEEVFRADSMATFAHAPVTLNHPPPGPLGSRKISAATWKRDAVGHAVGAPRREGDQAVADLLIRDAATVQAIKSGKVRFVSLGYEQDYDPTPGTTPTGERFDGIQRNIRGNHIALLPAGVQPRGGENCSLRLDAQGDEECSAVNSLQMTPEQIEALQAQNTALAGENAKLRTDAAEVPVLRASLATAAADLATAKAAVSPERLDALLTERATQVAKDADLAAKRKTIKERTPALAERVDSYSAETVEAVFATYASLPHPSMKVLAGQNAPAVPAVERADAVSPTNISALQAKVAANGAAAFKAARGIVL
jgi:hypothetical protein